MKLPIHARSAARSVALLAAAAVAPSAAAQSSGSTERWEVQQTIVAPGPAGHGKPLKVRQRLQVVDASSPPGPAQIYATPADEAATGRVRPPAAEATAGRPSAPRTTPGDIAATAGAGAAYGDWAIGQPAPQTAQAPGVTLETAGMAKIGSDGPDRYGRHDEGLESLPPDDLALLRGPLLSEVRVGALIHDAGFFGGRKEESYDVNVELLFRPFSFMRWIGTPRPHLGASINTAGDTSTLYTGLTWQWNDVLIPGAFIEASLGLTVHNGKLTTNDADAGERKELGSRLLFRESVAIGYKFLGKHSLSVMLDHISNANTSSTNEGLDALGLRYGYRF